VDGRVKPGHDERRGNPFFSRHARTRPAHPAKRRGFTRESRSTTGRNGRRRQGSECLPSRHARARPAHPRVSDTLAAADNRE
jgi:hypothetical protein